MNNVPSLIITPHCRLRGKSLTNAASDSESMVAMDRFFNPFTASITLPCQTRRLP